MVDRIYSTVSFSDVDDEGFGTSTNLSFSARDKKDLLRLLRLSGIVDDSQSIEDWFADHSVDPTNPEVLDFNDDETIRNIDDIDEQADYDYGKERTNRKGKKFPLNPYDYEASQEDEKLVDPRFGDNPLKENRRKRFSRRR